MIPAGNLRERVTIERQMGGVDGMGAQVHSWGVVVKDRAAQKTPVSDGERVRAAQVGATITDRFLIRWEERLVDFVDRAAGDRLWLKRPGRAPLLYNITGAKEVGYRDGIEITASADPTSTEAPTSAPWVPSP